MGQVIVNDWVEWLRENVQPHSLSSDTIEEKSESRQLNGEVSSSLQSPLINTKANVIPVPLPEKEFMGGVNSDEFAITSKCV